MPADILIYHPDLITYGKIIGGGMPVGAYGGRADVMQVVSPVGSVYQAGTLSGNPVAMAAGITQLKILKETPEVYKKTFELGEMLRNGAADIIKEAGLPYKVTGIGSLSCIFFTDKEVTDYTSAKTSDTAEFAKYSIICYHEVITLDQASLNQSLCLRHIQKKILIRHLRI